MIEAIQFKLNGETVRLKVDGERMLLWILRTDLGLTGTKYGCGEEQCGACTVLVNGEAILSCQMPVKQVAGKEVVTIEGFGGSGGLHPLQKAFVEHDALQCGFCTPGMILATKAFLAKNPNPTEQEVRTALSGNLCRCTGYVRIVEAVMTSAERLRG